ncbi:LysM peptidoglycan-binding domain-containing protein [Hugenholtzia roseola]|uniref:LysM peptidoglycan-binding domain-containing protein n=1 Tax=Hugenholtzia roseola TaxID=1002 RepID=UPI0004091E51|nr:LysM peptidoglycan-binding domain-containing protein [Hugenholtzia roseola]
MKPYRFSPHFWLPFPKKQTLMLLSLWAFVGGALLLTISPSKAQNPLWQIEEKEDRNINGKIFSFGKVNQLKAILPEETDMISELAKAAGIEVVDFLKYNDLNVSATVESGQVYYLEPKHKIALVSMHVLSEGEDFWQVSQRYGLELKRLYHYNRLEENTKPEVGRVLWLQSRRPKNVPVEIRTVEATRGIVVSRIEGETATLNKIVNDTTKKPNLAQEDPELKQQWEENLREEGFIDAKPEEATEQKLDTLAQKVAQNTTAPQKENPTEQPFKNQEEPQKNTATTLAPEKQATTQLETRNGDLYYTTQQEAERLDSIANRYKVYVADLRFWNNLDIATKTFPKGTKLIVGKTSQKVAQNTQTTTKLSTPQRLNDSLYLPVPDTKVQNVASPAHFVNPDVQYHYVKKGETIWQIAKLYGIEHKKLIEWNQLGTGDDIAIDQQIVLKEYLALPKKEATAQTFVENTRGLGTSENTTTTATQNNNQNTAQNTTQNTATNPSKPTREEILKIGGDPDKAGTKGYDMYGFQVAMAEPEKPLLKADTAQILLHVVGEKETLWTIAKEFGVSSGDLMRWNKLQDNGILHQGTKLIVRGGDALPAQLLEKHKQEQTQDLLQNIPAPNSKGEGLHVVQKGETIYHVAKRYNLMPDQIITWNALAKDVIDLKAGETLIVSQPQPIKNNPTQEKNQEKQTATDSTKTTTSPDTALASNQELAAKNEVWVYHTVSSGDTLNKIANLYGVSKDQIRQWNEMKDDIVRLNARLIVGKK